MSFDIEKFSYRLTVLLDENNMTQTQLAKKIGTSNVTICRYLTCERLPRLDVVTKIADVFNISLDYLLGLSDDKTVQNLTEKAQEVVSEVTQGVTQKATQAAQNFKFADIKFDKGIASLNGEKFTGTVSDTLTGGDKITLTYENGKIMQSVREGSKNVTKKFEYNCAPCSSADATKITTLNSEGKVIRETELGFETVDKIKYRTFPDGTTRAWHKNGQLRCEILPDGTEKGWYKNGQLEFETFTDGTRKGWHKNGQLRCETFTDGTRKEWHENGQLRLETFPDGTIKHFDLDGQEIK